MLCLNCKAFDAEDVYIEDGQLRWVCSPHCLEEYLNEKCTETPRVPTTEEGGTVGETTALHDLQEGHPGPVWPLG